MFAAGECVDGKFFTKQPDGSMTPLPQADAACNGGAAAAGVSPFAAPSVPPAADASSYVAACEAKASGSLSNDTSEKPLGGCVDGLSNDSFQAWCRMRGAELFRDEYINNYS